MDKATNQGMVPPRLLIELKKALTFSEDRIAYPQRLISEFGLKVVLKPKPEEDEYFNGHRGRGWRRKQKRLRLGAKKKKRKTKKLKKKNGYYRVFSNGY